MMGFVGFPIGLIGASVINGRVRSGYGVNHDEDTNNPLFFTDEEKSFIWWDGLKEDEKEKTMIRFKLTVGNKTKETVTKMDIYSMWLGRLRQDF